MFSLASDECIVYGSRVGGHRLSYLQLFARIFDLTIVDDLPGWRTAWRLIRARKLMFSTLDDTLGLFVFVAVLRSFLLRRTVGLFLSPHSCFEVKGHRYRLKLVLFTLLKRIPKLTVATITPYDISPEFSRVSRAGLHDPQYWDRTVDIQPPQPPQTELSLRLTELAQGRIILGHIGLVSQVKGTAFLANVLERHAHLGSKYFVACVGDIRRGEESLANGLISSGVFVLGRHATEDEIESLYGVASLMWCCYPPDFDRASGVFGRAVQYGVKPILRTGSNIHRLSAQLGQSALDVVYEDDAALAKMLEEFAKPPVLTKVRERQGHELAKILAWRDNFINTVSSHL
jgi:hypothetical protein